MTVVKRYFVGAIGVVALIFALALAVAAKTPKLDCIDENCNFTGDVVTSNEVDTQTLNSTVMSLSSWGEAPAFFGHSFLAAGPSDESTLSQYGLDTGYVDVDNVYAGEIYADDLYVTYSKSFRIDDPMDPANKYLNHWSIESDELKNIYDGIVTLDQGGTASVELPSWFKSLNGDFRYQLTAIGGPGANLYVAEEISDGRFKIAGGAPKLKVSWQVTGIRHDRSAARNRKPVEELKTDADRGKYLDPAAYGQPLSTRLQHNQATKPMIAPRPTTKPAVATPKSVPSTETPAASKPAGVTAPPKRLSCLSPSKGLRTAALPIGAAGLVMSLGSVLAFRRARKQR